MKDWDLLRVFLAVAREGQILGAASTLGLNHATVARRLDSLEGMLGTILFERRPAGSVLTAAGDRLMPIAERIETEMFGAIEHLRHEEASVSGTVRIGVPDGLGNYYLAASLSHVAERHPDLIIELVPLPRSFSLSRREADLAIALDKPTEGRLIVSRLTDYSLSIYAAEGYLEKYGEPQSLQDLGDHSAVTGVSDYAYASALDYSAVLEANAGRLFRCASVMGQMEAVKAGAGIGVLHDFAVCSSLGLKRLFPETVFRRSYYMLGHPDTISIRRVALCRDVITGLLREDRRRFLPFE